MKCVMDVYIMHLTEMVWPTRFLLHSKHYKLNSRNALETRGCGYFIGDIYFGWTTRTRVIFSKSQPLTSISKSNLKVERTSKSTLVANKGNKQSLKHYCRCKSKNNAVGELLCEAEF